MCRLEQPASADTSVMPVPSKYSSPSPQPSTQPLPEAAAPTTSDTGKGGQEETRGTATGAIGGFALTENEHEPGRDFAVEFTWTPDTEGE